MEKKFSFKSIKMGPSTVSKCNKQKMKEYCQQKRKRKKEQIKKMKEQKVKYWRSCHRNFSEEEKGKKVSMCEIIPEISLTKKTKRRKVIVKNTVKN